MSTPAPAHVTLLSLPGAWRRRSIQWPDGRRDTSTYVLWLQGHVDYADLRTPAGRPSFEGCRSFEECSPEQLNWIATQQGFAGSLIEREDGTFNWRRDIDFQPPGGKLDVGRLRYVNLDKSVMIEDGVEEPYVEVWERPRRRSVIEPPPVTLRIPQGPEGRGLVVAAGGYFMVAIDRRPPLPPAGSLLELLQSSPRDGNPARFLDMELSLGTWEADPRRWIVTKSTLPWREGEHALNTDTSTAEAVISAFSQ